MPSRLIDGAFPTELLLQIISHLPFDDGKIISTLSSVHPRISSVLGLYERSTTKIFVNNGLRHAPTDFPRAAERQGYEWLSECVKRYDVVDDIMAVLVSDQNCYKTEIHNMALVNTGMLLLYCLADIESHDDKLSFIKSLSRDPLVAIYLAINHATLTARFHGEGLLNQRRYGTHMDANALQIRMDVDFAFQESCLQVGPTFIQSTLLNHDPSETTLLNVYHDRAIHDWNMEDFGQGELKPPVTQGPHRQKAWGRSVWTIMLERLSELKEYPLEDVRRLISEEVDTSDHRLAYLSLHGKERLIAGLDLEHSED